MRTAWILAAIASAFLLTSAARAEPVRLMTWNIEWLSERCECLPEDGAKLCVVRDGRKVRDQDFEGLKAVVDELRPDIVAFQEVDGQDAAALVFDPAVYDIVLTTEDDTQRPGFAVRRGITFRQLPDLVALDPRPDAIGCGNRSL